MAAPFGDTQGDEASVLRANLLGPFSITLGEKMAGPWARPPAKRLCELVLVSPGRRIGREAVCEALFPNLVPTTAARAVSQALSMARAGLSSLGEQGHALLQADRTLIWANRAVQLEVDLEIHEERLRKALRAGPGPARDDQLVLALAGEGTLLEDEPFSDWALRPRERLERARHDARLALARDRARGSGRPGAAAVAEAWEACLSHDPSSEESALALIQVYAAQGRHTLAEAAYRRCRAALEDLGLRASPALEEARRATIPADLPSQRPAAGARYPTKEERRLVSVLFAEVAGPRATAQRLGPEDLRELVGGALAGIVAQVEVLGGTVTSVSGAGLVAIFGAPEAHEDDPERALLAALRAVSGARTETSGLSVRVGVETGPAVVGPVGGASTAYYGAFGEVVTAAAALQSVARPASVLVGPATRAATDVLFDWGSTEQVTTSPGTEPMTASYLERPKARPSGQAGRRALAGSAPLVGREAELDSLREAVREAVAGEGGAIVIVGEPGLGKTRLVSECRRMFMAWVGSATGRLPLWLEGRAASYSSSRPYGLYQQLLSAWMGMAPDQGEGTVRAALLRAMKAVFAGGMDEEQFGLVSQVMGLGQGPAGAPLAKLTPEELQRATFGALRAVVSRLAHHGPTVLVLEDLHWADHTSLQLTEDLACLTKDGPLLLLLTRRPEPDPGVSALEAALGAEAGLRLRRLELVPLAGTAERDLARALLGGGASNEVVDAVSAGAEGNPLFLEERLASLLDTRALVRGEEGWRLDRSTPTELPEVLERLIRSRVDRLGLSAREAVVAASVLGPEFSLLALDAVSAADVELPGAVAELCSAGLLIELGRLPQPTFRFRHALIQEAAYRSLLRGQRRQLHARAAWAIEEASADRLEDVAGLLGHHFAAAGEPERAAHYLELAGDRAASVFANEEAIVSYRSALAIVEGGHFDPEVMAEAAVRLRTQLAEVFWQMGRTATAREVLYEAIGLTGLEGTAPAARLYNRLGRVETREYRFEDALGAFEAAQARLGRYSEDWDQQVVDLWLEIQLEGFAEVYFWLNEPAKIGAVMNMVRPVVEARGGPAQWQSFYGRLVSQPLLESRYRVDEEILANSRAALAAAYEGSGLSQVAYRLDHLGTQLAMHGDLAEAEERLNEGMGIAQRVGDAPLEAEFLHDLLLTKLRGQDARAVAALAPQVLAAADLTHRPDYPAVAKSSLVWLAWREGRCAEVEALATEAQASWPNMPAVWNPAQWIFLLPLMAVRLAAGQVAEAITACRQLLVPPQQRLPDELESTAEAAIEAWEKADVQLAAAMLSEAVDLARRLRFA